MLTATLTAHTSLASKFCSRSRNCGPLGLPLVSLLCCGYSLGARGCLTWDVARTCQLMLPTQEGRQSLANDHDASPALTLPCDLNCLPNALLAGLPLSSATHHPSSRAALLLRGSFHHRAIRHSSMRFSSLFAAPLVLLPTPLALALPSTVVYDVYPSNISSWASLPFPLCHPSPSHPTDNASALDRA